MEKIKNVIFDLGGVVIDLKREKAVEALEKLGFAGADEMLGLYRQKDPFLSLETGKVTAGEFFDIIRRETGREVTDIQIQDAINEFLRGLPVSRLEALRRLREAGYGVYALSNTNAVMFHSWIANAFRQEGLSFRDYFDGAVTSFEEGVCKPEPEIFNIVLRRYGLKAEETLMLDDSEKNCEAARSCGMQSIRIGSSPADDMIAVVNQLISDRK